MDDDFLAVLAHAQIYLESAEANRDRGARWLPVAYDEARHAAELAGKALLLRKTGSYPKRGKAGHRIGSLLAREGLVPRGLDFLDLNGLLDHHTRGAYGFGRPFGAHEVEIAIETARAMTEAALGWPDAKFQPPLPGEAYETDSSDSM